MVDITSSSPALHSNGFRSFLASLLPRRNAANSVGILSGFTAYRIYNDLNAKSDAQLADMNLTRADIAQVAFRQAFKA